MRNSIRHWRAGSEKKRSSEQLSPASAAAATKRVVVVDARILLAVGEMAVLDGGRTENVVAEEDEDESATTAHARART